LLNSIVTGLTLLLVVATQLPLTRFQVWWVRSLDFPRLQLFVIAVSLLICQWVFIDVGNFPLFDCLMMLPTLGCVIYQGWWILPYTPLFPKEVASNKNKSLDTLSILTANVLTPNRNTEGLKQLIKQYSPDIIVTLESDKWWEQQLESLEENYPFTIKCPLDNLYGMHVYSRLTLSDISIKYLVESDVPSMHACVCLASGENVAMHFLHPAPPSPTENDESKERDAELLVVAKSVQDVKSPVVVTGDLNDVAWSETTRLFRKISGLLDPRVGRGMFNTYNARHWFLRWPLDHLFHSGHFQVNVLKRLPDFGSDHFPLFSVLSLTTAIKDQSQQGLEADNDDKKLANNKIDREAVDEDDVPQP